MLSASVKRNVVFCTLPLLKCKSKSGPRQRWTVPKIFLVHMRNERIPELIKGLFVFSTEVEVYWYSHGVAGEL